MYTRSIQHLADLLIEKCKEMPAEQAMLTGISGIDASGKGSIAAKLAEVLARSRNVAIISADDWLNLPHVRFGSNHRARHFYKNALRLDEMFAQLILPLKRQRSIDICADITEETADGFHRFRYKYYDVDVILFEGIFLYMSRYLPYFDLKIWIDCSFESAMRCAIVRSQEGLSPEETVTAYREIYFPAQLLHLTSDRPKASADIIFDNSD